MKQLRTIYTRTELIQFVGEELVDELEEQGLEYQLAGGRYVVDLRDLPQELGLLDGDDDDDDDEQADFEESDDFEEEGEDCE